jgi:hypothetical protein
MYIGPIPVWYGKLWMKEHTDDLDDELTFRGLEEFLLLGWKDKKH